MNFLDIKSKRLRLGLTQKEFADALGLGRYGDRTLRRWENKETKPSNLEQQMILSFPESPPFANSSTSHKFTMIDLFAGIGGIRLPFQRVGGLSVFSSEWDKFAAKTYKANFGDEPNGDITKINSSDIPNHNILLAGFPCQPFSQAGLKKGFEDIRGTLFFDIARILKEKKPQTFLLENVKQLRGHNRGDTLKTILRVLSELNYTVYYKVHRAADFGVPQNRERIYIVGFNNSYKGKEIKFNFPAPTYEKTRLGDILEKEVNDKYTISDQLYQGHLRRKEEHKRKGNGFGFSLFNSESPYANTLSARYYKDGSEILIDQGPNKNPRKLTPRECARLQGFPEEFIIPVSDTQAYRQFGNSVAIPVIAAIAKEIVNSIESTSGFVIREQSNLVTAI
jgi:DNA (cytosine-5)-methyltransferase 1